MQKTLLILTAGVWQLPVIRTAKSMGLRTVVTDRDANAPGFSISDAHEVIDTRDREGMVGVARKHRADGVIAEQTDIAVTTAAYVAGQLGLPGIGEEAAVAATNKFVMREQCRLAGIPTPRYRRVRSADEAAAAARDIGFPVVLKPVDAQSSRGVAKLASTEEVTRWFASASEFSSDGSVLVEEMMRGIESSIEAFVADGNVAVFGICEKVKCPPPYSFDVRLIYPASFPPETIDEMIRLNERVVRALGIPLGITHGEYIITPDGPRLIEIAARGCGARVVTDLVPAMTGVDLIRARIHQALGEEVDLTPTRSLAGLLEFLMLPPGVVRRIEGVERAKRLPGVLDVGLFVKEGDVVRTARNGTERSGFVLAVAEDRDGLLQISREVCRTIRYEVDRDVSPFVSRVRDPAC